MLERLGESGRFIERIAKFISWLFAVIVSFANSIPYCTYCARYGGITVWHSLIFAITVALDYHVNPTRRGRIGVYLKGIHLLEQ